MKRSAASRAGSRPASAAPSLSLSRAVLGVLFPVFALPSWAATITPLVSTNLPPTPPSVPEITFSLFRIGGALALVLAVFFGGVWLFQNSSRLGGLRGRTQRLQVLEIRPLGNRHALFVVGYDQQRLLIASSPNGVSLLERLPEAPPSENIPVPAPSSFAETLRGLLKPR